MIQLSECRIGNIFLLDVDLVEMIGLTLESYTFRKLHNQDHLVTEPRGTSSVIPVVLTRTILEEQLHFVSYAAPGSKGSGDEYTDGRIILRDNTTKMAVFKPNDFPWAQNIGLHMDYILSIVHFHELQNVYFDLFKEELAFSFPHPLDNTR